MTENPKPEHLKRVLVECAFASSLRVARDVSVFQERFARGFRYQSIGSKNPFAVRNSVPGYHFENTRLGVEMDLFENSFSFAVTDYPGFEAFRNKARLLVTSMTALFGIARVHRVGLRYTNVWYVLPEDGEYKFSEQFFPHLDFSHPDVKGCRQFYLDLQTKLPTGGLNTRSTFQTETLDPAKPASQGITEFGTYTLDFDAYHKRRFAPMEFESILNGLHQQIKLAYTRHLRNL